MWYLKNVSSWVKDLGKTGAFSSTVRTSPQIPLPNRRKGPKKGPIGVVRLGGRSRGIKVIGLSLVRSLKNLISHPRFPPSSASCWTATFIRWLRVLTSPSTRHRRALCKHLQTSVDRVKGLFMVICSLRKKKEITNKDTLAAVRTTGRVWRSALQADGTSLESLSDGCCVLPGDQSPSCFSHFRLF